MSDRKKFSGWPSGTKALLDQILTGYSKRQKAEAGEFDLGSPIELVVLAPKQRAARCRVVGTGRELTLRSKDVWDMVPGEVITVRASTQWTYGGHLYLSGNVESRRLDIDALGLVPLRLLDQWPWDPTEEDWGDGDCGDEDEPVEEWLSAIIARGPRPSFEMEQVLPGVDPDDWDSDPILQASELDEAGDSHGARKLLVALLAADLRCLDAHAHLGHFVFDHTPAKALRHYEVGVRIGELLLGPPFDGLLLWNRTDNRPFLRCMHGLGLCLWRAGRSAEAEAVFERLLSLNPTDEQGIRFLLPRVRAREAWEDYEGEG